MTQTVNGVNLAPTTDPRDPNLSAPNGRTLNLSDNRGTDKYAVRTKTSKTYPSTMVTLRGWSK